MLTNRHTGMFQIIGDQDRKKVGGCPIFLCVTPGVNDSNLIQEFIETLKDLRNLMVGYYPPPLPSFC